MSGGDQLVPLTRPMYSCWAAKLPHRERYILFLATFTFGAFLIGDLMHVMIQSYTLGLAGQLNWCMGKDTLYSDNNNYFSFLYSTSFVLL